MPYKHWYRQIDYGKYYQGVTNYPPRQKRACLESRDPLFNLWHSVIFGMGRVKLGSSDLLHKADHSQYLLTNDKLSEKGDTVTLT